MFTGSNCPYCERQLAKKTRHRHFQTCEYALEKRSCNSCSETILVREFLVHHRSCGKKCKNCKQCGKKVLRQDIKWHYKTCLHTAPEGTSTTIEDTLISNPFPISTSINKGVQEKQTFRRSIEASCQQDQSSITRVSNDEELNKLLAQPFMTPILWRGFTQHHPLHGIPSSISDFLQELRRYNIQKLDVYNYTAIDKVNYQESLDKIIEHFQALPDSRPPLNFLDIRNQIISRVPVHVNKVDLLRLARRRQAGSASKSIPQGLQQDYADHEFFLLSSRKSLSTLHCDTAGYSTYIEIISGQKIWYLPRNFTSQSYEILATLGSSTPETYPDGWVMIKLEPGDLLIMPPGCPHAVFTPEDSLAFGGNFYTLPHLGSSLRVLSLQTQYGDVFSNEDLSEQDYSNFLLMMETCMDLMEPEQMTNIASSGISWGIQAHHKTRDEVSRIRWKSQRFLDAQRKIRLLIWDIQNKLQNEFS
ncbi:hypothetical protein BDW59DRAFT_155645 [Aspergillus cavernicola]|uniref:[histone H3]-dimethyl-L-lysine(36) demethylase n=1 Tax=Aspergillus cavernicola TaxID=176166 RepID=A0ABR4H3V5_9EURO